jgi:glyoxylase-like metal-dependent hydrolase (beta-lactamase superfamily II)
VDRIAEIVAHYDLTVRAIVHTHAHLDHIYCTREVAERHGGAICLHDGDAFLYDAFAQQAAMFGWQPRATRPVDRWITDGERVALGHRELLVIHTPGHTPGSVCFEVADPDHGPLLLAGDTLFRRSVGRTDLPGGDARTLERSIQQRLYTRDPDALVIPGHGPTTTLGDEARANPFVRA